MTSAERRATVLFVVFVLLVLPQPARARTIKVGDGTAASCTEDALRNALAFAGGERSSIIRFNCGVEPVAIAVTATLTVPDNTRIDGGGLITLDGQLSTAPILRVDRDTTVALKDLTIDRGANQFAFAMFGGGLFNEGIVTVHGCTFSRNIAFRGGGILNQGTLTVHDSTFSHNFGSIGGGINSQGTLAVHGSTFAGNGSASGGGIFAQGTLRVHNSAFYGNDGFRAGALMLDTGTHTISSSTITQNHGEESAGGIGLVGGTLTVKDSSITQNRNGGHGGGFYVVGATLTIKNSTITENLGGFVGGGILNFEGTVTIDDSTIAQNSAGQGGGIYNSGVLAVTDSTITENTAGLGGGIYNANIFPPGETPTGLTVKDSTITQNTALVDGGGIYTCCGASPPTLTNTLVTNNTPNDIVP